MKLPIEPEFEDQAPRMLRKDSKALGNTLLGMRGLWHGSKFSMSLAPKRKIWLPREKEECLRDFWELKAPFPASVSVGDFHS
ncbi:unnamed protein product [Prunus brigantina]